MTAKIELNAVKENGEGVARKIMTVWAADVREGFEEIRQQGLRRQERLQAQVEKGTMSAFDYVQVDILSLKLSSPGEIRDFCEFFGSTKVADRMSDWINNCL